MDSTVRKVRTVQTEGLRQVERDLEFYNLDAIISVGYRVNSYQATQFRIWATKTLKEYIIKGFVLDDERLKQGNRALARTISKNSLSESGKSAQVSDGFIKRSPTSTPSPPIMTKTPQYQRIFSPRSRTNSTGQSPEKPQQKLFTIRQMQQKSTWV